jgi:membrane protease YdiL (CAAX protease family)
VTPAAAAAHRWGLREAIYGFAIGLVVSTLATTVAESIVGGPTGTNRPLAVPVIATDLCGLWVGLIGAAIVASRRYGTRSLAADFGFRLGRWWDLPVGAGIGLACQYGLIPLLYLPFEHADSSLAKRIAQPAQTDTGSAHTVLAVAVLLFFLAVGAPLVEELFFRGLLLRSLAGWVSVPGAVVISGLLFALAHFEAIQFAGLAVFGIVLGIVAWRTGRLGPTVAAHSAFNAAAVLSTVHLH